ncbi:MAG TPA: serine/threonine-protein kinase [Polyangiaceae bacterium]|jgi:tRNA A-37 threonylcarbamoyl transferase component Bud32|nr:serine/threonine-protein kinase [Polyangiaceae bacterium]
MADLRPFPRSSRAPATPKPPSACPDTIDQLGKYHLIAFLARGGMADVYLGVIRGLVGFSKLLVLKELRHDATDDETYVGMFMDEARLAARLNHPNVVQTIEVGEEGARRFIAMEYLDGQPLNRVLSRARKRGAPMDPGMHLRIVADVLTALAYAHSLTDFDGGELGIVHRDVSPQNVFVTYDGAVKLIDFGVAKTRLASQETLSGVLKGKLRYMAPEQTTGHAVDSRADLFAAGIMLWEAVAGESPWEGGEDLTILRSLMAGSIPRLRIAHPDVDPEIADIVDRATSPDPRSRYQDAIAMRADLEAYLDRHARTTHMPVSRGGRDLAAFVSALYADDRRQMKALVQAQLAVLARAASANDAAADAAGDSAAESGGVTGSRLRDSASVAWRAQRSASEARADAGPLVEQDGPISGVTPSSHRLPDDDGDPGDPAPSPFAVPASVAADATAAEARAAEFRRAARRRWTVVAAVAGAAIAASGLAVVWKVTARASDARNLAVTAPSAAMVGLEAPAPVGALANPVRLEPARMELVVRVVPSFARLSVDGVPASNPFSASYPRDGSIHRVEARAPGFDPRIEDVTFDRDATLELSLERHFASAPAPRAVAPASVPDAKPAAVTPTAESADRTSGRPRVHPIETEDPYSSSR